MAEEKLLASPEWLHLANKKTGLRVGSYVLASSAVRVIVAVRVDGVSDTWVPHSFQLPG